MSSKLVRDPCGEAAGQGRCCTESRCSRAAQKSYVDLLRDDAFLTPVEGIGGEAEGEREPKTNVQPGVGTEHTAQHNNTHTHREGNIAGQTAMYIKQWRLN